LELTISLASEGNIVIVVSSYIVKKSNAFIINKKGLFRLSLSGLYPNDINLAIEDLQTATTT
jgi:hypothetical protein